MFAEATGGFQRRSPTGGAAYGIPKNACTTPSSLPSTTPVPVFTCGAADSPNKPSGKANITHTTSDLRIFALTIFAFMRSPSTGSNSRTPHCNGNNLRRALFRSLANLSPRIYNQLHDRCS